MGKSFFRCLLILLLSSFSLAAHAWASLEHKIIAQIALDNLTPQAKSQINKLLNSRGHQEFEKAFLKASNWADLIRENDVTAFNSWHYINLSFSTDKSPLIPVNPENVAWAIEQAEKVLQSQKSNPYEKRLFLKFLLHFVGDIEQPLHCVSFVSKQFPFGDQGGGLFPIADPEYPNLHVLWDNSVGYFDSDPNRFKYKQIRLSADLLQQRYPRKLFTDKLLELNPQVWAAQSFLLAKQFVYKIPQHNRPSEEYIKQGQVMATKQMTLAGYRLADELNKTFI